MKSIVTKQAPEAIGPYSQGVDLGDLVLTSGQIPLNPMTGEIPEGIQAQAKQSLENVKGVIEASGLKMENVVKMTVFLKDMETFAKMNEVYKTFFEEPYPARSAVEVARLPKDVLIEIEAIASRPNT
jgi:2-iminobutanoate/2-iminopropanoate deaminase